MVEKNKSQKKSLWISLFLLFLPNIHAGSFISLGLTDPKHKEQYVGQDNVHIVFCEGLFGKQTSHIFCFVLTLH